MHHRYPHLALALALTAGCAGDDPDIAAGEELIEFAPEPAGTLVAMKMRALGDEGYTFAKYVDERGEVSAVVYGPGGRVIPASAVPALRAPVIGPHLQQVIDSLPGDALYVADDTPIDVVVALHEPSVVTYEPEEYGNATIDETGAASVEIDGRPVTDETVRALVQAHQARLERDERAREDARRALWLEVQRAHAHLGAQPAFAAAIERGRGSATLSIARARIPALAKDPSIAGIELYSPAANELAAAMLDTKVDPYAIGYSGRKGDGIGVYMSEGGCPDTSHITNYYRVSGAPDSHSKNVSAILRGVSPDSYVYCKSGYTLPSSTDLQGYGGNPPVYVETHSWGITTSDNDDYLTTDRDFDNHVYDTAMAVFKSAGNFGSDNGYISSPGKALNVISVGNYDDSTGAIRASSSYLDSEIGNEKPELVAPGTNICAGGVCMTGTSMASPHAAGFAADLMGAYSWLMLKPYYVKALMLAASDKAVSGGDDKVGVGGLNFYRAYYGGTNSWWQGSNGSFSSFDSSDYLPNNGYVDRAVDLDASKSNVRIALVWLNRGTYTYDHRADAHAIGMDFDITVYDPSGNVVAGSYSFDNPYEMVSFDPTVTGTYRVRISRFANRDTSSKLHMGLSIDW